MLDILYIYFVSRIKKKVKLFEGNIFFFLLFSVYVRTIQQVRDKNIIHQIWSNVIFFQ